MERLEGLLNSLPHSRQVYTFAVKSEVPLGIMRSWLLEGSFLSSNLLLIMCEGGIRWLPGSKVEGRKVASLGIGLGMNDDGRGTWYWLRVATGLGPRLGQLKGYCPLLYLGIGLTTAADDEFNANGDLKKSNGKFDPMNSVPQRLKRTGSRDEGLGQLVGKLKKPKEAESRIGRDKGGDCIALPSAAESPLKKSFSALLSVNRKQEQLNILVLKKTLIKLRASLRQPRKLHAKVKINENHLAFLVV